MFMLNKQPHEDESKIKLIYCTKFGKIIKFQHGDETTVDELARSLVDFITATGYSSKSVAEYMVEIIEDNEKYICERSCTKDIDNIDDIE